MAPIYSSKRWTFDKAAWSETVKRLVELHGLEFVAGILEVSPQAVSGWVTMSGAAYEKYPWPQMKNFVLVCATFDIDPRLFWTTED